MTPEQAQAINDAFRDMAKAILPPLRRLGEQIAVVGQRIEEITDDAYRKAGQPFGESSESKWRWLRECARAEQLRAEADEIESWHRALALIREKRGDA